MTLLWLATLTAMLTVAMSMLQLRRRGDVRLERVSERWLTEQRATDRYHSER
jgi:hypothetical protein